MNNAAQVKGTIVLPLESSKSVEILLKKQTTKINEECSLVLSPSIIIVGVVLFAADSSRGILFPILTQRIHQFDGDYVDIGYVVAVFSLGRMLIMTPLGIFCDMYRHRRSLIIANILLLGGAILWANSTSLIMIYLSQFLLGCGSGSLGVTRSYVIEQVAPKFRTEVVSIMTAIQYAGFTMSPFIGAALSEIGARWNHYWLFALPSYSIALIALGSCISILVFFVDIIPGNFENIDLKPPDNSPNVVDISNSSRSSSSSRFSKSVSFFKSTDDRLLVPPSSPSRSHSNRSRSKESDISSENRSVKSCSANTLLDDSNASRAVSETNEDDDGECVTLVGRVIRVTRDELYRRQDAYLVLTLMIFLNLVIKGATAVFETLGAEILISYYSMSTLLLGGVVSAAGTVGFVNIMFFSSLWTKNFSDLDLIQGGMGVMAASQFLVLSFRSRPSLELFLTGFVVMYALGYPVAHTAVLGAFSKIQKSGPQATLMGAFASSSCLARILFPVLSVNLVHIFGYNSPFALVLTLLLGSMLGVSRIRPLVMRLTECVIFEQTPFSRVIYGVEVFVLLIALLFAICSFFLSPSDITGETGDGEYSAAI